MKFASRDNVFAFEIFIVNYTLELRYATSSRYHEGIIFFFFSLRANVPLRRENKCSSMYETRMKVHNYLRHTHNKTRIASSFPQREESEGERKSFPFCEFRENLLHVGLWAYIECTKVLGTAARLLCEGPNGRMSNDVDERLYPMRTFIVGSIIFARGIFAGNFTLL